MKIAFITSEFITESNWYGGLANYLAKTTKGLVARGHQVDIFVISHETRTFTWNNVTIHRVKYNQNIFRIVNILSLNVIPPVLDRILISIQLRNAFNKKNKQYDIVQTTNCFLVGLFLNHSSTKSPIVMRLSSIFKYNQESKRKTAGIQYFLINMMEKITVRKSDAVYAPSSLVSAFGEKEFQVHIDTIEPLYYTFDGKQDDEIYNSLKGLKYLLFYGSLKKKKGIEFIARNIYQLLRSNPDYYFVFVGKDLPIETILSSRMIQLEAKEHSNRILYFPPLPHTKLFSIIKNARAIILPSMFDNLPNALIESMSLKKVVLGTYEGGFDQLIENNRNGFLCHYGDNKTFIELVHTICSLPEEELHTMGLKAYNDISKKMDPDIKLDELEKYFKHIIKLYA